VDPHVRGKFTSPKKALKSAIRRPGIIAFLHIDSSAVHSIERGGETLGLVTGEFVCRAIVRQTDEACVYLLRSSSDLDLHRPDVTRREPDAHYGAGSRHGHLTKMKGF